MGIPLGVCFAGADDRILARVSAGAAQDTQRAARPPRGLRKILPLKAPGPPANVAGAVAGHGILGPHLAQCDLSYCASSGAVCLVVMRAERPVVMRVVRRRVNSVFCVVWRRVCCLDCAEYPFVLHDALMHTEVVLGFINRRMFNISRPSAYAPAYVIF
jgi:hypothetical protein